MKIMMLGWELPPHNSGGLGVACYQLSKALAAHGASIDFVLPYRAYHPDTGHMRIHHATEAEPLHPRGMGAYTGFNPDQLSQVRHKYSQYVSRQVKKLRPNVIHAHEWLTFDAAVEAKRRYGTPLIAHVHATEFDRAGGRTGNQAIADIERNGLLMADRIIAVSNITKQIIVKNYHIPADKIEVVHNSIDSSSMGLAAMSANNYLYVRTMQDEGYIVVTVLTRLTVQKGLTFFLEAAAKASKFIDRMLFLIVGDGEQRDELVRLSADLGIADKVLFTGFLRGERWREAYRVSDVFVMSSVSEPFGLTALEAAAHQTSLIITKQSGVGEVVKNALRYDYWDTDKLADQIVNLASSAALRRELGAGALDEFNHLSWQDAAKRCMQQYQQLGAAA